MHGLLMPTKAKFISYLTLNPFKKAFPSFLIYIFSCLSVLKVLILVACMALTCNKWARTTFKHVINEQDIVIEMIDYMIRN